MSVNRETRQPRKRDRFIETLSGIFSRSRNASPDRGTHSVSTPALGGHSRSARADSSPVTGLIDPRSASSQSIGRGRLSGPNVLGTDTTTVEAERENMDVPDRPNVHYGNLSNTTNTFHGQANILEHVETANFVMNDDSRVLDSLPKHPRIRCLPNEYLPNSRADDVKEVSGWIDDPAQGLVLWIHAPAGFGKSTLAHHLKELLRSQGRLAAAIFLSALQTDSWDPETVIQLISGEIGRSHQRAVPSITDAIRQCHGASLQDQLEKYIRDPLHSLQQQHPLVIIMDALDEWKFHHLFLKELVALNSSTSVVKFIILARIDPHISANRRDLGSLFMRSHPLPPASITVISTYLEEKTRLKRNEEDC